MMNERTSAVAQQLISPKRLKKMEKKILQLGFSLMMISVLDFYTHEPNIGKKVMRKL